MSARRRSGCALEHGGAGLPAPVRRRAPLEWWSFRDPPVAAVEAATAIGCDVAQIAKSLIFRRSDSGLPVLVIASGANRVDEGLVSTYLKATIGKADAAFVRASTGFAIGGVPPIGHQAPVQTLIDRDLLRFETIWAAAGTPNAVFALTPEQLVRATGGEVVAVRD